MGSIFELCIVGLNKNKASEFLERGIAEIKRIEQLLTEFSSDSITSRINQNSGIEPVEAPQEFLQLTKRSLQISKLTQGYFDISVGPLKNLYEFKNKTFKMPVKASIKEALKTVGYKNIQITDNYVFLKQHRMHISFAAIGKGYAADAVKQLWSNLGVSSGYINASGDLTAFGTNEFSESWKIGIANPDNKNQTLFYVPLSNASVATSGDYEQHFIYKGKRYSHNINPKTGLPILGIKSVSVFSPSAELSDALATAIYAMGINKGLDFVNQLPQTHAIVIDAENIVTFSKNLNYETVN